MGPHPGGLRALRVLIAIENMSYTFDTRVRNIARTLERNGSRVWVICPRYPGDPLKRVEGAVTVYFFPLPPLPGGLAGHVLEYLYSFASITVATLIAFFRVRFDVIHICNPPDIFFPLGRLYRLLGRKFLFDQHDLCPELWQVRYRESRFMRSVLLALERSTLASANHVLSTSETARERICQRARIRRSHVTLVRNGPDLANFPSPASTDAAPENVIEVGYIGDMNPQDGIDHLLRAARHIRYALGRTDVRFVLIGDGSASDLLRQQVEAMHLSDCVQFTGRMRPPDAMRRLSACTLCVQPDLKNPFNDACVMVKSLEYMALGKPLVAFDLNETRRICGEAALYATSNDHENLARAILRLADDATLRRRLGEVGRRRIEQSLAWSFSERQLLKAYARLRRTKKPHPRRARAASRRIRWYWNRMRAMSPSELQSRLMVSGRTWMWRHRRSWVAPAPRLGSADSWQLTTNLSEAREEVRRLLAEAEQVLAGRFDPDALPFDLVPPDWHLDPQTGKRPPLDFAFEIDRRNSSVVGNVRNIWELNRHRHVTLLAAAYAVSRDERFAAEVHRQLTSWVEQNPVACGVNWQSALELGVRLIAWVWIERLLRGSPQHAALFGENGCLWPAVYWHQWFIARNRAFGSSANHHLIGEMAGLFIASTVWPYFEESAAWQTLARKVLEQQIRVQTFASGIHREQAFSYHCLALELFLLAAVEAERNGNAFSAAYRERVERMLAVIPVLTDAGGNLPRYGDDDAGTALQLQPTGASRVDWLFRLGQTCTRRCPAAPRPAAGMLAALLIRPDVSDQGSGRVLPLAATPLAFEDAGLFVLVNNRGTPREMFCLADAGPLGFLRIAAHGHADALSFALSVGGVPVIIDPGSGCYFVDSQMRAYFRSTRAHNTVVVDGRDQSEPAGPYLWRRHASCQVLQWLPSVDGGELYADHDGYAGPGNSVIHRRHLQLADNRLLISDELVGRGQHDIEWRLHFAPECRVALRGLGCDVCWRGGCLEIDLPLGFAWRIARGGPDGGWYSPARLAKQPTATLIGSCRATLPYVFHARLRADVSVEASARALPSA